MFERYTENARRTIFFARYEASQYGSLEITTEHLLLGLAREAEHLIRHLLRGISVEAIRSEVEKHLLPSSERVPTNVAIPPSQACTAVLHGAAQEADRLNDKHIGTEHLLLGLLGQEKSPAARILADLGLTHSRAQEQIAKASARLRIRWCGGSAARPHLRDRGLLAPSNYVPEDVPPDLGARWGAGYVRKTQLLTRLFHWERRHCVPRDALRHLKGGQVYLYAGRPYNEAEFALVEKGWTHDHCVICWQNLILPDNPEQSFGYTNGQDWLCPQCYEIFVTRESKS